MKHRYDANTRRGGTRRLLALILVLAVVLSAAGSMSFAAPEPALQVTTEMDTEASDVSDLTPVPDPGSTAIENSAGTADTDRQLPSDSLLPDDAAPDSDAPDVFGPEQGEIPASGGESSTDPEETRIPESEGIHTPAELAIALTDPQSAQSAVVLAADIIASSSEAAFSVPAGMVRTLNLNGHALVLDGDTTGGFAVLGVLNVADTSSRKTGSIAGSGSLENIFTVRGRGAALNVTGTDIRLSGACTRALSVSLGASATFENVRIDGSGLARTENGVPSSANGGAILADGPDTAVSLSSTSVTNTRAANGGAIAVTNGAALNISQLPSAATSAGDVAAAINGCTAAGDGGAVYVDGGGSSATVCAGDFTGNTATGNGGAFAVTSGTLKLSGGSICSNRAGEAAHGGGIWTGYDGILLLDAPAENALTITANTAGSSGGGIFLNDPASCSLEGYASITGNAAGGRDADVYPASAALGAGITAGVVEEEMPAPSDPATGAPPEETPGGADTSDDGIRAPGADELEEPGAPEDGNPAQQNDKSPVVSYEALAAALDRGGTVRLESDIEVPRVGESKVPLAVPADVPDVLLVLNGHSITAEGTPGTDLFTVNGNLTVQDTEDGLASGGGSISYAGGENIFRVSGGTLEVKSGTLHTEPDAQRAIAVDSGGTLTMMGGTIDGAGTAQHGGAILIEGAEDSTTKTQANLTGVAISGTQAANGGAIALIRGELLLGAGTSIAGCKAVGTAARAASGMGGAVYQASGDLTICGASITGCKAAGSGGALCMDGGTLAMTSGLLDSCRAESGSGGGICATAGEVRLSGGTIGGCAAALSGGGIYIGEGASIATSSLNANDLIVTGNTAQSGGGMFVASGARTFFAGAADLTGNHAASGAASIAAPADTIVPAAIRTDGDIATISDDDKLQVSTWAEFTNALREAASNDANTTTCIQLAGDIARPDETTDPCTIQGPGKIAVDLNGHTLSGIGSGTNSNAFIVANTADVSIQDSSAVGTGRISFTDTGNVIRIEKGGKADLSSGTILLDKTTDHAVHVGEGSQLTITGATISGPTEGDHYGSAIVVVESGSVTFTAGTIENVMVTNRSAYSGNTGGGAISDSAYRTSSGTPHPGSGKIEISGSAVIRRCRTEGGHTGVGGRGGAISLCNKTDLTISGGTITQCTSNYEGGAIYASGNGATVTMRGGRIDQCRTLISGGGIYVKGGAIYLWNWAKAEITGGTIEQCKAAGGGALGVEKAASVRIMDGVISQCQALYQDGGAIYVDGANSRVTMSGGAIDQCTACSAGGGIYVNESARLTMDGGTISGCVAQQNGGGICLEGVAPSVEMSGGTITGCQAMLGDRKMPALGGGIYVGGSGSTMRISGGTISGCLVESEYRDGAKGAGIYIASNCSVEMTGAGGTIKQCQAESGGGIYVAGKFTTAASSSPGVVIKENSVTGAGAGLYAESNANVTLGGTGTIKDNTTVKGAPSEVYPADMQSASVTFVIAQSEINEAYLMLRDMLMGADPSTAKGIEGTVEWKKGADTPTVILLDDIAQKNVGYKISDSSEIPNIAITTESRSVVLDLNGHSIVADGIGSTILFEISMYDGNVTITDSSDSKSGRIRFQEGQSIFKVVARSIETGTHGCVRFESGTLEVTDTILRAVGLYPYLVGKNKPENSTFVMAGGTIEDSAGKDGVNGRAVFISDNQQFTLEEGTIRNCQTSGNGSAICVRGNGEYGGKFTMNGGRIENCRTSGNGGAIYVEGTLDSDDPNREFTMTGGTIENCRADRNGGAVYVNGGRTQQDSNTETAAGGKFMMAGGTIENCSAGGGGGAVYVNGGNTWKTTPTLGGEFTMTSGAITNCRADGDGGAIYVNDGSAGSGGSQKASGGKFAMEGGTIESCATNGKGGIVYMNDGIVTISRGKLTGVSADADLDDWLTSGNVPCNAASGGAIYVASGAASLAASTISGFHATEDGGAICVGDPSSMPKATLTVEGDTSIQDCSAARNGGAVCIYEGSAANFTGSGNITISECKAINGGGIYAAPGATLKTAVGSNDSASMQVTNNTATAQGGGIWAEVGDQGAVTLGGTGSVNGNSAPEGQEVYPSSLKATDSTFEIAETPYETLRKMLLNGTDIKPGVPGVVWDGGTNPPTIRLAASIVQSNIGTADVQPLVLGQTAVVLDLNGHTISAVGADSNTNLFTVPTSSKGFTIKDSSSGNGKIRFENGNNIVMISAPDAQRTAAVAPVTLEGGTLEITGSIARAVEVKANREFEMTGGTITGYAQSGTQNGGAILTSGTVDFSGGTIRNTGADNAERTFGNGGAIALEGQAAVTMSGTATISGCNAYGNGGAIWMQSGSFTMEGGVIENCSSAENGGAIYAGGGKVGISGGNLTGRSDGCTDAFLLTEDGVPCNAQCGGALYVADTANASLTGGTMGGFRVTKSGAAVYYAGRAEASPLTMNGVTIQDCAARGAAADIADGNDLGGAICAASGTVEITVPQGGINWSVTGTVSNPQGQTVTGWNADAIVAANDAIINITGAEGTERPKMTVTGASNMLNMAGNRPSATLKNITFALTAGAERAILMRGGTLDMENAAITGSGNGNGYGGGVWIAEGTATVKNCSVSGAQATSGGAICVGAPDGSSGTLTLEAPSTIDGCKAIGGGNPQATTVGNGGGVCVFAGSTAKFQGSQNITISDCSASGLGGGIFYDAATPSSGRAGSLTTDVTDSGKVCITGNTSGEDLPGGGIYIQNYNAETNPNPVDFGGNANVSENNMMTDSSGKSMPRGECSNVYPASAVPPDNDNFVVGENNGVKVEPSPTPSPTPTGSASVSPTGSASVSPTGSASVSPTGSASVSPTGSASVSPTGSASVSPTGSASVSPTGSASVSPTPTSSATMTSSPTGSVSARPTGTVSSRPTSVPTEPLPVITPAPSWPTSVPTTPIPVTTPVPTTSAVPTATASATGSPSATASAEKVEIGVKPGAAVETRPSSAQGDVLNGSALIATKRGTRAEYVLGMLEAPSGFHIVLCTRDGNPIGPHGIVATGDIAVLVYNATGEVRQTLTIIVYGDVTGTGIINLTQLVRMAASYTGRISLEWPYTEAGDFTRTGRIDLADLVREAALYAKGTPPVTATGHQWHESVA